MRKLLIFSALIALAGCKTLPDQIQPEHRIVRETTYIVRVPPKEMLVLPERPANINPDTASQAEVAEWLIRKEQYTLQLESLIKQIAAFLVKAQDEADDRAARENASNQETSR